MDPKSDKSETSETVNCCSSWQQDPGGAKHMIELMEKGHHSKANSLRMLREMLPTVMSPEQENALTFILVNLKY